MTALPPIEPGPSSADLPTADLDLPVIEALETELAALRAELDRIDAEAVADAPSREAAD